MLLMWILYVWYVICVCHVVLSVHCSLMVTCLEMNNLLYVMFSCVFVTFPCGVLGQVWYLIVSIPDICLLPYFDMFCFVSFLVLQSSWWGIEKLIALLCLSSVSLVIVMWFFPTLPWVGKQRVIVVFCDHTHLFVFLIIQHTTNIEFLIC